MLKKIIVGMGCSLMVLMATSANAADKVGGSYFVTWFEGDEPNDPEARPLTAEDYDRLAFLQHVCNRQMEAQRPNMVLEVGHDVALSVVTQTPGIVVGALVGFGKTAAPPSKYAPYGAGAAAGGGAFAGISGRGHANKYDDGQCMAAQLRFSQSLKGNLVGKAIIMNAHSINGHGIKRPSLREQQADEARDARLLAESLADSKTPKPVVRDPKALANDPSPFIP